jgi:hypothetical protein
MGLIVTVLLSTTSTVFAQEINFGQPATQTVKIIINEDGSAHITHVVAPGTTSQQLSVIRNDFTNLKITNENGESAQYGETGSEKVGFVIFPASRKVLVEYDLINAVTEKDGMWTWNYLYLANTLFFLPEKTDLIFVNGSPINLADANGINCHGCRAKLEYQLDKTEMVKQVQWEDKKFDVRIITTANISSFEFDQPNKKISFDTNNTNRYITLIIPKELLQNPYEVFLNEKKLLNHEFFSDETNAWISVKPNETGTVDIIGTSAIPEFPITAVLILAAAMIFATKYTNKFNLR